MAKKHKRKCKGKLEFAYWQLVKDKRGRIKYMPMYQIVLPAFKDL